MEFSSWCKKSLRNVLEKVELWGKLQGKKSKSYFERHFTPKTTMWLPVQNFNSIKTIVPERGVSVSRFKMHANAHVLEWSLRKDQLIASSAEQVFNTCISKSGRLVHISTSLPSEGNGLPDFFQSDFSPLVTSTSRTSASLRIHSQHFYHVEQRLDSMAVRIWQSWGRERERSRKYEPRNFLVGYSIIFGQLISECCTCVLVELKNEGENTCQHLVFFQKKCVLRTFDAPRIATVVPSSFVWPFQEMNCENMKRNDDRVEFSKFQLLNFQRRNAKMWRQQQWFITHLNRCP